MVIDIWVQELFRSATTWRLMSSKRFACCFSFQICRLIYFMYSPYWPVCLIFFLSEKHGVSKSTISWWPCMASLREQENPTEVVPHWPGWCSPFILGTPSRSQPISSAWRQNRD
ncbi:uncharacterized protein BO72DRAFT_278074 [Aspergillus fijiensis CBS 313.89]|uniref:Uncharacterized protein n=1 Tax=Aspergillus fijiensis CBS 313.89 TaxID=1448319 RepID=A0A8G1RFH5_9EURO|nr:uncharacterized protein BO72DRAFT_278074 [Aspergillus fijiensis CBS 313.89]RAK72365.1 hypothetical protein BO72DRAFT_278074 [Aspergillus fijiensis CBS 313.89]